MACRRFKELKPTRNDDEVFEVRVWKEVLGLRLRAVRLGEADEGFWG